MSLREQFALAKEGKAQGQCPECGTYRGDGKPVDFHGPGCPHNTPDAVWPDDPRYYALEVDELSEPVSRIPISYYIDGIGWE